jgi:hypothetical protein
MVSSFLMTLSRVNLLGLLVVTCWFFLWFCFCFSKNFGSKFLHAKKNCFQFVFTFSPSFLHLFLCGKGYKLGCAFSFSLCNEGHDDINVVFNLLTSSWNFMVNVKDVEDSSSTCTFHSFFSITRRWLSIDSSQLLWSLNKLLIIMVLVLVLLDFKWTSIHDLESTI